MPICWLNLRYSPPARVQTFALGAQACGFEVTDGLPAHAPASDDILITWNRIGRADQVARQFRRVLVAENASWGNFFAGQRWLYLARTYHNTAGCFPVYSAARWDNLGVKLLPFRSSGGETVLLPQRGIGSAPTVMPFGWARRAQAKYGGRVRSHPGRGPALVSLEDDLARTGRVVTWGSGAAIQALMWGIFVVSEMPNWVGEQDNTEVGRLAMFQRLAWAQAKLTEITTGEAIQRLL